jgi:alanine racemase
MNYSLVKRPVWAEINLDNIEKNFKSVKKIVGKDVKVAAVIKSDAYGLGAVEIAPIFEKNGADYFAVATLTEGIQLRRRHREIPIMILGYTPVEIIGDVIENDIEQTVYTKDQAMAFNHVAREYGKKIKLHINIDSGMNRLGFRPSEKAIDDIEYICTKLEYVDVVGIFTHFAVADETDKSFSRKQMDKFSYVIEEIEKRDIDIPLKHVSNSAGIIDMPEYNFNMVRAGIILYGCYPSEFVEQDKLEIEPVINLKAEISYVKEVPKGEGISYGLTYTTNDEKRIATLPIGYGDGFSRLLSGKGKAICKDHIVPIVGRICMDQCMIDVTGLDVNVGDVATLYGSEEKSSISIDSVAKSLGTINYEVLCMIHKRVPRIYIKDGEVVKTKDYVLME